MGVYIAAGLATALSLALWGTSLRRLAPRDERPLLALAFALALPMFAVALWGVRLPLTDPLLVRFAALFHPELPERALRATAAYLLPKSLEAPLVEEPAKLWPLAFFFVRERLKACHPVRVALSIGLGFAVGEAWGLAALLARDPLYGRLPFWMFGGFVMERVMVALFHGAFTSMALRRWGTATAAGLLAAMAAHWAGNFPIVLRALDVPPLGRAWPWVITAWLWGYFAAMAVVVGRALKRGA